MSAIRREPSRTSVRQKLVNVPGARFTLGSGAIGEKMQLILASDNALALKASAQSLERELRGVGQLSNISSTASLERPEIVIRPDLQRAAERGVTTAAIGDVVRIATRGDFDAQVARLNLDNRQVYIRVRIADAARQDIDTLANLRVAGRDGLVPLSSIAAVSLESGPSQIDRYDRRRYVTVNADLGGMPLGSALAAAKELPAVKGLPSSVKLIETGDAEIAGELAAGFSMALVVGVLCVFSVLVLLFKDFLQPITILSAIPLSLGGALVALLLRAQRARRARHDRPRHAHGHRHQELHSARRVRRDRHARARFVPRRGAYRCLSQARPPDRHDDGCHDCRHVAHRAGTRRGCEFPAADGDCRDWGLLTSTALSLLVVPVVFTYIDGIDQWLRTRTQRRAHGLIQQSESGS